MNRLARAFRVMLVLWAGSLWSAAIWVAPTLFHAQPDRALAGLLAGRLFSIEAYLGLATAALALILPGRAKFLWGYVAAALLSVMQWVLRPVMAEAHLHGVAWGLSFGAWHGVSALLYGGACIAVLLVVWNDDFR
ncbi:MAG: DUF4149 domain-containing protein [Steroidobacterales bacterium]